MTTRRYRAVEEGVIDHSPNKKSRRRRAPEERVGIINHASLPCAAGRPTRGGGYKATPHFNPINRRRRAPEERVIHVSMYTYANTVVYHAAPLSVGPRLLEEGLKLNK